jgi:elongation factor 1-alpha
MPPKRPFNPPLRLPVQDVHNISAIGTVPLGRVVSSMMKPGQKIVFARSEMAIDVKSIRMHRDESANAHDLSDGMCVEVVARLPVGSLIWGENGH